MTTRRGFLQGVMASTVLAGCRQNKEGNPSTIESDEVENSDSNEPDTGFLEDTGLREEEPEPWELSQTEDRDLFPYGVRVGDATIDSVIIAIYTTDSVNSLQYEVRRAKDDGWISEREGELVLDDGHGQFELDGLDGDTAYGIVFFNADNTKRSKRARFRTALSDNDWRIVTFGATSCLKKNRPWPNLIHAAADQHDFFCFLGDTVYAYAETREEYWEYWDEYLKEDGLYELFGSCSMIATWDDHEITNNFNWDEFPDAQEQFENALWAFRRGLPQRQGDSGQIWRKIRYGKVMEIFVLDCKGETINGKYISDQQMEWLKEGLSQSNARFKIVLNSVPITDYKDRVGNIGADNRWQGFPVQREEILNHIENNNLEGVLWVTGDYHFGAITRIGAAGEVGDSLYEVMAGPSGSFLNPMGWLGETEQYLLNFAEWNYARFICNPDTGEILVQFIGDTGDIIREMSLML